MRNPQCHRDACKRYIQRFPERRKETCKRYDAAHRIEQQEYNKLRRRERLTINGKQIRVDKRPYPENCELCGKAPENRRFDYHHWDDKTPEYGLWLCKRCHLFVGWIEKYPYLISLYSELKGKVSKGEI